MSNFSPRLLAGLFASSLFVIGIFVSISATPTYAQETAEETEIDAGDMMREATALAREQDFEGAIEVIEKLIKADDKNFRAMMMGSQLYMQHGVMIAQTQERKLAQEPLRRGAELMRAVLEGKGELNDQEMQLMAISVYNEACCAAVDDDADAAFKLLEEAVEFGFDDVGTLENDSDFDSVKEDPRFEAMITKLDEAAEAEAEGNRPETDG